MNMVIIRSNFYELNFISVRDFKANVPQLIIDSLGRNDPPVFCGTNKMVQ